MHRFKFYCAPDLLYLSISAFQVFIVYMGIYLSSRYLSVSSDLLNLSDV